MYFHNSLIPRGAYFLLPLKSKQEATSGWNFTKCISEVKVNHLEMENIHVKMGISTFNIILSVFVFVFVFVFFFNLLSIPSIYINIYIYIYIYIYIKYFFRRGDFLHASQHLISLYLTTMSIKSTKENDQYHVTTKTIVFTLFLAAILNILISKWPMIQKKKNTNTQSK